MESEKGNMRLRKHALTPIQTKIIQNTEEEVVDQDPVSPGGRLFHEPNFNVHILAIMGSKVKLESDIIKANLPHTLLKHPRFCSVMEEIGGDMKWVRTEVDLDKHVIVHEVDLVDSMNCPPKKIVEDYLYNLTKTRIDKTRPLWDLHILNVGSSEAEGVGILRVHHSLGDGVSLISLLLACTRQTAVPGALPTLPTAEKKKKKETVGFARKFSKVFFRLWWVFKLFWNTVVDVLMFLATALFLVKDTKTPFKGPLGTENNPRRIVFKIVSLDDLKFVKNAMNMTINDVALGVTQAGLSKYLNRRYGLENNTHEEQNEKKNNLPKKIRLRSIFFINIRPAAGIQALADMMEKNTKAKWGNSFGYVLFPFTIGLRDDPLDYIREAKANIDRKKHSYECFASFSIVGLVYKFFGLKSASALFRRLFISTTMGFSNVVGPLEEIGFHGHPLTFVAATTYGQANELMIHVTSYVNNVTVALSVDENTIPDPHQLCDDIVESLKLIKNTVLEKKFVN